MKKLVILSLIAAFSMTFMACPKKEEAQSEAPAEESNTEAPATDSAADKAVDTAKEAATDAAKKAVDEAAKKVPSGL